MYKFYNLLLGSTPPEIELYFEMYSKTAGIVGDVKDEASPRSPE